MIEAAHTLLNFGDSGVSWFPQEYAHMFFLIKGGLALVGCLGLVIHMTYIWNHDLPESSAQQWRYLALLSYAVLTAGSTLQQVKDNFPVHYANLGVLVCILLLFVAVIKSLKGDYQHYRRQKNDTTHTESRHLPWRHVQPHGDFQDRDSGGKRPGSGGSHRGYRESANQTYR